MFSKLNRRKFITVVAPSALIGVSSCASLDSYIFEDDSYLKKQVPIVGGGISGLYLGQLIRKKGNEFRLFEGSSQLGGRIRSAEGIDYGASIFSQADHKLNDLLKEFSLSKEFISKDLFFIPLGTETLIQEMAQRNAGLIPSRSLKLKSKLIAISKINSYFEMTFETPQGRRTYVSQRLALALPPNQWHKVDGLLELSEMAMMKSWLATLEIENAIKFRLKPSAAKTKTKLIEKSEEGFRYRLLSKGNLGIEGEIFYMANNKEMTAEKINQILADHIKLNRLGDETDSMFDWSSINLIQAAYYKNKQPFPAQDNPNFQVFGDYSALQKTNTVEGALSEAVRVSEIFV